MTDEEATPTSEESAEACKVVVRLPPEAGEAELDALLSAAERSALTHRALLRGKPASKQAAKRVTLAWLAFAPPRVAHAFVARLAATPRVEAAVALHRAAPPARRAAPRHALAAAADFRRFCAAYDDASASPPAAAATTATTPSPTVAPQAALVAQLIAQAPRKGKGKGKGKGKRTGAGPGAGQQAGQPPFRLADYPLYPSVADLRGLTKKQRGLLRRRRKAHEKAGALPARRPLAPLALTCAVCRAQATRHSPAGQAGSRCHQRQCRGAAAVEQQC